MRLAVLLPIVYSLFATFSLAADPSSPAAIPDHVTAVVSQGWAENIAYGRHTAREIVLALIVDDGVRGRGHRKNIFNPTYNVAGAAYGSHARFGSVCSIDFASGYVENRFVRAGSDAQNSF